MASISTTLLMDFLWCFVLMAFAWGLCFAFTYAIPLYHPKERRMLEVLTQSQRIEAADILFSLPFYVLLVGLAQVSFYELYGDLSSRWTGVTVASKYAMILFSFRMFLHSPVQWVVLKGSPEFRLQMMVHHLYSGGCAFVALVLGRGHFWFVFTLIAEVSTVFLNGVLGLKWLSPQNSTLYCVINTFCGVMLWIGFIVFRLVMLPVLSIWFLWDASMYPSKTLSNWTTFELVIYSLTVPLLIVLAFVWFGPITQGFFKALKNMCSDTKNVAHDQDKCVSQGLKDQKEDTLRHR